jgi:hypothetical protein
MIGLKRERERETRIREEKGGFRKNYSENPQDIIMMLPTKGSCTPTKCPTTGPQELRRKCTDSLREIQRRESTDRSGLCLYQDKMEKHEFLGGQVP